MVWLTTTLIKKEWEEPVSQHHELATWRCHIQVAKFLGDWEPGMEPYAVDEYDGNALMIGGVSVILEALEGLGTATAGQALTYFNTTSSAIGVGNGTAAVVTTQTNLQGASRLRKQVDVGFPDHTDGTTGTANQVIYRSTFGTAEANFAWEEAGVFNSATDAVGRMLNRKLQVMGTKTSSSSWQITFTITIS